MPSPRFPPNRGLRGNHAGTGPSGPGTGLPYRGGNYQRIFRRRPRPGIAGRNPASSCATSGLRSSTRPARNRLNRRFPRKRGRTGGWKRWTIRCTCISSKSARCPCSPASRRSRFSGAWRTRTTKSGGFFSASASPPANTSPWRKNSLSEPPARALRPRHRRPGNVRPRAASPGPAPAGQPRPAAGPAGG